MNRIQGVVIASAALLVWAVGCGDDNNQPNNAATSFTATLSGGEEVPAVSTTATGTATFTLNGSQIDYTVNVVGIENAILGHIHLAPVGQNGDVRLNLCGTGAPQPPCTSGTGVLAMGSNGTTVGSPPITFDDLVAAMRSGGAYVNVHTAAHPAGEIRGQIEPQ